jgi:hypothetical protein
VHQLVLSHVRGVLLGLRDASIHEDVVFTRVTVEISGHEHVATGIFRGQVGLSRHLRTQDHQPFDVRFGVIDDGMQELAGIL